MFQNKDNTSEEQNFWISYADLMAGLLFVFILLVGAIVIKYVYIQTDLQAVKVNLANEKRALNISDEELEKKKNILTKLNIKLQKSKEESVHLSFEVARTQNLYNQTKKNLESTKVLNEKLNLNLDDKNKKLQLSNEQIKKITSILNDKEDKIVLLQDAIQKQKNTISTQLESIDLNSIELEKLKKLLLGYELKTKEYATNKQDLENQLLQNKNTINLTRQELVQLEKKLLTQSKEHQKLVEEFDITKVKIKNLTGVRIKVITALKDKLGDSIDIDQKSGSIRFSSNILFNKAQFELKENSQKELSALLKKYIHILLLDEKVKQHIDHITIEGHTDSDGTYLNNLELSQKRALEVMKFLYSLDFKNKELLERYISASGRSSSNLVYKNGIEDKDASRRIEIKFQIKNEQAIKEIENYLDK
jgi:chemotaxis protein MotB